jgi:hypothetical protein
MITRPEPTEYDKVYQGYVALVPETDIQSVLEKQKDEVSGRFRNLPQHGWDHRYEPGKWSVREVLGHVIDSERAFGYRALAFARGERQPLPGMDQEEWMEHASYSHCPPAELLEEFEMVRRGHLLFFCHLAEEAWPRVGVAYDRPVTVRALAWIMAGHVRHHLKVLQERYGVATPA